MNFAERSKELRNEKSISQIDLSKKIGVSKACISMIEIGKNEPTARTLLAYSDFFGVSIDYLLGREDDFGNINTNADLSAEESEIIETFRSLTSDRDKTLFLLFVRNMQSDNLLKKYHKKES